MPSSGMLARRLIRLFTLTFSRSVGLKNIQPNVPHLLDATARQ